MRVSVHGGPDARGVPVHDFSTNANACGPCPGALDAVREADVSRYPDPAYFALRERLAAFHGVESARVVVAASASEFIARITAAVAQEGPGAVQVPQLAYGDYAQAAAAHGLSVLRAGTCRPDGEAVRLVWRCEPSSPLGQNDTDLPTHDGERRNAMPVVLDRAYDPLRLAGASSCTLQQLQQVWQVWSPNKALGMTGVRGAYAVAPVDAPALLLSRLQALAPSWPLGAHAVAMLCAWTEQSTQHWLAESRWTLASWKARQQRLCASLGWQVLNSEANFFCARWPERVPMRALLDRLRACGVKLRDCASFGLDRHVRLGVLPPTSQDALGDAWTRASSGGE